MNTDTKIMNLILFVILPLWGISGLLDWWCHKKTRIEETSGLKESLIHALMGIQIGIPIVLGIFFDFTVLTFLIMIVFLLMHEFVAHLDVSYSSDKREITIWEVHIHNYLATLPFYILALISVLGWDVVKNTFTLNWGGDFYIGLRESPRGGATYYLIFGIFMSAVCVFPYLSEIRRCWIYQRKQLKNGD